MEGHRPGRRGQVGRAQLVGAEGFSFSGITERDPRGTWLRALQSFAIEMNLGGDKPALTHGSPYLFDLSPAVLILIQEKAVFRLV